MNASILRMDKQIVINVYNTILKRIYAQEYILYLYYIYFKICILSESGQRLESPLSILIKLQKTQKHNLY